MGRQLVLAVAGAGKTTRILNELSANRRSLVLTYTNQNLFSLEDSIRARNEGSIPQFVELRSYFSFLYSFCVRPFYSYDLRDKGFLYGPVPKSAQMTKKNSIGHYVSTDGYLYAARAAKLVRERGALAKVQRRLAKHFDNLYVDEIQDFSANDFNLLLDLAQADVNSLYVGDYFQHTYDTSRDGNIRANLHLNGIDAYAAEFKKAGFEIDTNSLSYSRRCSEAVCSHISQTIGIKIESARNDDTRIVFVTEPGEIHALYRNDGIVKLFYQNSSTHECYGNNWGNSKGLDRYQDVCVVLNKTAYEMLAMGRGKELKPATRNKLYVACSRTRGNLFFVEERLLKSVLYR